MILSSPLKTFMQLAMYPGAAVCCLTGFLSVANAHELWIDLQEPFGAPGAEIIADIKIGPDFTGDALMYLPGNIRQLQLITKDGAQAVNGRVGDRPAIQTEAGAAGQQILTYQSEPEKIFYYDMNKFSAFLQEKDAEHILDAHRRRGLSTQMFVERYMRFAKALFSRGAVQTGIRDRQTGMEIEFVLDSGFLPAGPAAQVPVTLYYQGAVLADAQVTVFAKSSQGTVKKSRDRTDRNGQILLDLAAGHSYLIDHVVVREADRDSNQQGAVWESLWTSLSFSVPAS